MIIIDENNESIGELYRRSLTELTADWAEQVKEFRRLSLEATDPIEQTRMRAKADTLHYRYREIMGLLEEMDSIIEERKTNNPSEWPGLSGVLKA